MTTPLLISLHTASLMLGISPKTGRNWVSADIFPVETFRVGGRRLLRQKDVENYVENLGVQPLLAPAPPRGRPRK